MRVKLAHKLFLINASIMLILTAAFISLSYFSSKSMYSNALNGIDREVMDVLSKTLSEHYSQHQSWDAFTSNPSQWQQTVDKTFFSVFFSLMAKAAKDIGAPMAMGMAPPEYQDMPKWEFPFGTFLQRLSLLDSQKNALIEPEIFNQAATYKAIKVKGKTVGWLRVGSINVDMLPLAQYFFDQQLRIVYWSCLLGGLLAILLSFTLSRHITAPITHLTAMARRIAKRDFRSQVDIQTRDELQELAEGFNYASRELDLYQRRQKQWLADVSHELKTPLTVLVGEVFAICDDLSKCDETTAELLQSEALRIKRIADDLHQLCLIDEHGIPLKPQPISLQSILQEKVLYYYGRFQQKGIEIHETYLENPHMVMADGDRIAQVFCNLLENCLRYSQAPGHLFISEEISSAGVQIAIEDSGPGVPEESFDKIFERFHRIESPSRSHNGGSGLGLTISKEIILAHGGAIIAKQGAHGGLRIEITLRETHE